MRANSGEQSVYELAAAEWVVDQHSPLLVGRDVLDVFDWDEEDVSAESAGVDLDQIGPVDLPPKADSDDS